MKLLWAPWRMKYIQAEKSKECIFCQKLEENKDKTNYILFRKKNTFVILNTFPYNNGHLMVIPNRHLQGMEEMKEETLSELMITVKESVNLLKKTLKPDGFNIGINMGSVAGAGIKEHFHIHIIPRWQGDTNFMPTIAQTKVISQSLRETYNNLKNTYLAGRMAD